MSRSAVAVAGASFALVLGLAAAGTATAQEDAGRAAALERLLGCRDQAEAAARLACYDEAAAALDQAERAGDVVVLDRRQMDETRRGLFGFAMPQLDIFNRRGEADTAPEIDDVAYVIRRATQARDNEWVFEMEDGSVWRQIDGRMWSRPRAGDPAVVSRAALGSFMLRVDGGRPVRVRRER